MAKKKEAQLQSFTFYISGMKHVVQAADLEAAKKKLKKKVKSI